jgi:hypothetical protein
MRQADGGKRAVEFVWRGSLGGMKFNTECSRRDLRFPELGELA